MKRDRGPCLALLACLVASALACEPQDDVVTIKYQHHISAGNALTSNNQTINPGPGQSFALFHIVCIRNQDDQPQTFVFDPHEVYANNPDGTIENQANQLAGMTQSITVAAGAQKKFVGRLIMQMSGTWGGNEPRYLLYGSEGEESVLMVKDNFANLGGPTLDLDSLPSPAFPPGADPCEDDPIQPPH